MTAAKHTDPIVGMDMHLIQPPPPAPPMMVPIPVAGMVMDPADYQPGACTVYVNGLPRARAGNVCMLSPPHIPIGGMFVKPPLSEAELYQGSSTVTADGEAMSAMGHQVLGCHDIGAPAPVRSWKSSPAKSLMKAGSVVLPIPGGAPVMVGGSPTTAASGNASEAVELEWIRVEIVDGEGGPLVGAWYELELADGTIRSGGVSDLGVIELASVPAGNVKLTLSACVERVSCGTATTVGPPTNEPVSHVVAQGECVRSIAAWYGLGAKWEEVWSDGQNEALRSTRPDPYELLPGDVLVIPANLLERLELQTGQTHRIEAEVAMSQFNLVLHDSRRRLLQSRDVTIEWVGQTSVLRLTSGGDGSVSFEVPTSIDEAVLRVDATPQGATRKTWLTWLLHFRALDPALTETGVRGRLQNLGASRASIRTMSFESTQGKARATGTLAEWVDSAGRKRP